MEHIYSKIVVSPDKCTGCMACEMVCSLSMWGECNPTRSAIRNIRSEVNALVSTIPVLCQQCQDAICAAVCPVEAITRSAQTGAMLIDEDKCLGCRRCVYSCPFGGVSVDSDSFRASKCNLCNGDPECCKICPKDALNYVRIDQINVFEKRRSLAKYLDFMQEIS